MNDLDNKKLEERLAGLELSPFAIWVLDPGVYRIRWANGPALELWRSPSRDELYGRDFGGGVPQALKTRLEASVAAVSEGKSFWDDWTFFPNGVPIRTRIHFTQVRLDDGSTGVLHHVLPREQGPDPAALRGIEALTHTSIVVALVDYGGKVLMKNPAAIEAFGDDAVDWHGWLPDPAEAKAMLSRVAAGEIVHGEMPVRTTAGERFHSIELRPVRDAVTGVMVALVYHTDETARRGAEAEAEKQARLAAELDRTLSLVERQKQEISTLSAPLLEVGAWTLAVPLIGVFDASRGADVESRLLPAIGARQARFVILDLTGAASLDSSGTEALLRIVGAVRLLGARPILTGIRPALARVLVESGFDGGQLPILRSLAEGIGLARA